MESEEDPPVSTAPSTGPFTPEQCAWLTEFYVPRTSANTTSGSGDNLGGDDQPPVTTQTSGELRQMRVHAGEPPPAGKKEEEKRKGERGLPGACLAHSM